MDTAIVPNASRYAQCIEASKKAGPNVPNMVVKASSISGWPQ